MYTIVSIMSFVHVSFNFRRPEEFWIENTLQTLRRHEVAHDIPGPMDLLVTFMGEMLVPLPRYPNWQRGDEHGAKVVAFLLGAVSHYAAAPWHVQIFPIHEVWS